MSSDWLGEDLNPRLADFRLNGYGAPRNVGCCPDWGSLRDGLEGPWSSLSWGVSLGPALVGEGVQ